MAWLARYKHSPATLASYRKEAERLLLWCVHQHGKALSDLTHEDFLAYEAFLEDPQPAERWVMEVEQKARRSSSHWRPFAKPLDRQSQRQALSILNSLFNWLVQAGYLACNPLALRRRKSVARPAKTSRFLPHEHWAQVRATIEALTIGTPLAALQVARCRWLFSLFYIVIKRMRPNANPKRVPILRWFIVYFYKWLIDAATRLCSWHRQHRFFSSQSSARYRV